MREFGSEHPRSTSGSAEERAGMGGADLLSWLYVRVDESTAQRVSLSCIIAAFVNGSSPLIGVRIAPRRLHTMCHRRAHVVARKDCGVVFSSAGKDVGEENRAKYAVSQTKMPRSIKQRLDEIEFQMLGSRKTAPYGTTHPRPPHQQTFAGENRSMRQLDVPPGAAGGQELESDASMDTEVTHENGYARELNDPLRVANSGAQRMLAFQQLEQLVRDDSVDSVSLARSLKVLVRASRLSRGHGRAVHQFLESKKSSSFLNTWYAKMIPHLSELDSFSLVSLLHSFGALQIAPSREFVAKWEQVVRETGSLNELDEKSLATAFWAIGRNRTAAYSKDILQALSNRFEKVSAQASDQCVTLFLWSLTQVMFVPSASNLEAWSVAFVRNASVMNADALTKVVDSLGRLGKVNAGSSVEERVMPVWFAAWEETVSKDRFDVIDLCACLNAISKLAIRPSPEWLEKWTQAFERQVPTSKVRQRELTMSLSALHRLQVSPPPSFFRAWYAALARHLPSLPEQMVAFAYWGPWKYSSEWHITQQEFVEGFQSAFVDMSPSMNAQQVSDCIWALGKANMQPSRAFMDAWLVAFERVQDRCSAQQLCAMLWAMGKCSRAVLAPAEQASFLDLWYACFEREESGFVLNFYSMCLLSFARLQTEDAGEVSPLRDSFVKAFEDCFVAESASINSQILANVMHACAKLHLMPRADMLRVWFDRFVELAETDSSRASVFKPQELSMQLWGLAKLDIDIRTIYDPTAPAFLDSWCSCFERNAGLFQGHHVAIIMWAFAHWSHSFDIKSILPESFQVAWRTECARAASSMSPISVSQTLWPLGRLEAATMSLVSPQLMNALLDAFARCVKRMDSQEMVNSLWGCARMGPHLDFPDTLMIDWFYHASKNLPSFNPHELSNSLYALARLQRAPTESFLSLWMRCFAVRKSEFSAQHLVLALWALATLEFRILPDDFRRDWCRQFIRSNETLSSDYLPMAVSSMKHFDILR
ncbi:hypothetical protein FVE85_2680 [Porphyridium purpureum]|uniref:Tbc2 translation factor, chloroplastic n=1 Tax=Porphyridium purpureum TaxID=35688 RepID=A0A5J4YSQ2_PORPP|nr:hypothetical protein FVE85_2680 [Porphyridium purpureum]|eukprot:POR2996..scf227_4